MFGELRREASVHGDSAAFDGGGQEVGVDGRHGSAVGQSDVVELLRESSRDARVEPHELVRGVTAWSRRGATRPGGRELKFVPVFACHFPHRFR